MDDVTFSAESRSLWVMSYVIGGFVIGDEDCTGFSDHFLGITHIFIADSIRGSDFEKFRDSKI